MAQEVFEAVYCGVHRFQRRSDLVVWIYGIARNILNNRLRRRARARLVPLENLPLEATPLDPGPGPRAEAREALRYVQRAIEHLPPISNGCSSCATLSGCRSERSRRR